jgi:hypothetical protein
MGYKKFIIGSLDYYREHAIVGRWKDGRLASLP